MVRGAWQATIHGLANRHNWVTEHTRLPSLWGGPLGFLIASQGSGAEIQQVGRRFEFVIFDFSGLKFPFIFQYFCILVLLEKFHLVLYFPFAPQIWGACSSVGKESVCNAGDPGSIPGSGRCPWEGNGNILQCSCLENPMNRGAWQATVHGVARVGHDLATKPPPPPPIWELEKLMMCYCSIVVWRKWV